MTNQEYCANCGFNSDKCVCGDFKPMAKHHASRVTEKYIIAHVTNWIVPPECQGQIVEVSYGTDCDGLGFRRFYDQSDRTTLYEWCDLADCGCDDECNCWDPINREPSDFDFQPVTQ